MDLPVWRPANLPGGYRHQTPRRARSNRLLLFAYQGAVFDGRVQLGGRLLEAVRVKVVVVMPCRAQLE
jgi:hypothetical protein